MSDFLSQFENRVEQPSVNPPASNAASPVTLSTDQFASLSNTDTPERGIRAVEHRVEVDPSYRRSKIRRRILIAGIALAVALIATSFWYFSRLVEVPNLVGKQLSEAQVFSRNEEVDLEITEESSLDVDSGVVLGQGVEAGKTITKGSTLSLIVSRGPDPNEHLILPDFATMNRLAAEQWIAKIRADNLRVVIEFSDTVAKDEFLRIEFRSNDVDADNYRRSDYATLYYSKGAETFEKNITVPNFAKKTRADVESWAATNGIRLTVEEIDSDTIEAGFIISQSVTAGEKLAKNDEFGISVSLGKAIVIPNFANYTVETAAGAAEQVPIVIETRFNPNVPYGQLIRQSIPSGTRLLPGEVKPVTVVYSEGRPYLKDYRGTSEGDLPAAFFRDYTAKGATVTYELRYVDSFEPKGNIVSMSDFSRFIPMEYHVVIDVSKGNLTPPPEPIPAS
jgi:serine/threonine-protein kinase